MYFYRTLFFKQGIILKKTYIFNDNHKKMGKSD